MEMNNLNDIFDDVNLDGIVDAEEIVNIDIDGIDDNSIIDARAMVENLSKFYYDEEFMRSNPSLKKRIDSELESLRILIKMRKSDERTHDILLGAIAKNSSNASLYRALTETQKTILSITTKINDIVNGLNGLLKNYQLEIQWKEETVENSDNQDDDSDSEPGDIRDIHKGTKSFIEQMNREEDDFEGENEYE